MRITSLLSLLILVGATAAQDRVKDKFERLDAATWLVELPDEGSGVSIAKNDKQKCLALTGRAHMFNHSTNVKMLLGKMQVEWNSSDEEEAVFLVRCNGQVRNNEVTNAVRVTVTAKTVKAEHVIDKKSKPIGQEQKVDLPSGKWHRLEIKDEHFQGQKSEHDEWVLTIVINEKEILSEKYKPKDGFGELIGFAGPKKGTMRLRNFDWQKLNPTPKKDK